jgi:hypothetical protein
MVPVGYSVPDQKLILEKKLKPKSHARVGYVKTGSPLSKNRDFGGRPIQKQGKCAKLLFAGAK